MSSMIVLIMMWLYNDEIKLFKLYDQLKKCMSMLNHYEITLEIEDIDVEIIF